MSISEIRNFIKVKAEEYGAIIDWSKDRQIFERNNTDSEALKDDGAYFGFINPEEEQSGTYHDFSFTIFPSNPTDLENNNKQKPWLICLGIGSSGFKNDFEIASHPGLRRLFSKFIDEEGFIKSDFSDIETPLPKKFRENPKLFHLKKTLKKNDYDKVIPACQIVENPESEEGKKIIGAFLAGYAKLRDWPSNENQRRAISKALEPFSLKEEVIDSQEIQKLLNERKYIVLQGPPGTGKTRIAKEVAKNLNANIIFTQFHAETTFSDFIYGIRPDLENNVLSYVENLGSFTNALKVAKENNNQKVILIVDEINRANLSNVLGPIFYLFEHKMVESIVEIEISPGFKIKQLPDNFYVIATMNTADRSLAVVDFALRRRFAWYTISPKILNGKVSKLQVLRRWKGEMKEFKIEIVELENDQLFFCEDFIKIQEIFDWYASSNELSMQPGQGYFIALSDEEMFNRIKYEIFPLIKEYIQEGILKNAKEEFNNYFRDRINQTLFE